jgi:hypothetical protein
LIVGGGAAAKAPHLWKIINTTAAAAAAHTLQTKEGLPLTPFLLLLFTLRIENKKCCYYFLGCLITTVARGAAAVVARRLVVARRSSGRRLLAREAPNLGARSLCFQKRRE